MTHIFVTSHKEKEQYPIIIGTNLLEKISEIIQIKNYSKIVVITDTHVQFPYLKSLMISLPKNTAQISIAPGEKEKNIETVIFLWKLFQEHHLDRKSLVINLGGGVIGDMGGFAASTYMRGIDFMQIPTTLLSQVDASIGGKVGINFNGIKNAIGSFQPPIGVVIDIDTLQTLSQRVYLEGFGEIIKHGLVIDRDYFSFVTSKDPLTFSQPELLTMIARSVEIKQAIVEQDEKESGKRKILNFGHTIGHAIESVSYDKNTPLLHGESILLGMIVEVRLSQLRNLLSQKESAYILNILRTRGLPTIVDTMTKQELLIKIMYDKKNENGQTYWTLLTSIGTAKINQVVTIEDVSIALQEILHE